MRKLNFSPLLLIACVLSFSLSDSQTVCLQAQTPQKEGTATVSGRVLLKNEPVSGVTVELQSQNQIGSVNRAKTPRAKTDGDGRFHLTGIGAGQYNISALAPGFVSANNPMFGTPGKTLNISDGENIENIELTLKRGGVIAGRVTDSSNNPVIETMIRLHRVDQQGRSTPYYSGANSQIYQTDDRGEYRIWGLPAGRYRVSTGQSQQDDSGVYFQASRTFYSQTFHPNATDEPSAKIIEVTEESGATDIDIKLGEVKKTFDVAGRVIDATTGRPVAGVELGYGKINPGGRLAGWGGGMAVSNLQGEFVLQGVLPGNYGAFVNPPRDGSGDLYSDLSPFEVNDSDIVGIEVRAQRGTTINGTVVVEGTTDANVLGNLSQMSISTYSLSRETNSISRNSKVSANGSFRLTGMRPGKIAFSFYPRLPGLTLLRIEHNGAAARDGIEIRANESVNDVRLVFGYGNAIIRGQVKVIGPPLPEEISPYITAKLVGGGNFASDSSAVDARGQFVIRNLVAGEYELRVLSRLNGTPQPELMRKLTALLAKAKQTVSVSAGGEAQVTFTIDLSQQEKER